MRQIWNEVTWGVRTFQLNHANLEYLKQIPQKPGDLKRERFPKYVSNKTQKADILIFFTSIGQWIAK